MSSSVQPATNGNPYCPYGSEVQPTSPCGTTLDILAAGFLGFLFPEGIPTEVAAIVDGWDPGAFTISTLCVAGPPTCDPFSLSWLLSLAPVALQATVAEWLLCNAQLWVWNKCCQCLPPTLPGCTNVQSGSFPASTTTHEVQYCLASGDTGSYEAQYQLYVSNPINSAEQFGVQVVIGDACPTLGTGEATYCWGPGGTYPYGTAVISSMQAVGSGNSTNGIGLAAPKSGACPGTQTGAILQYVLCLTPTTPIVVNNPTPPPTLPPGVPALPSGNTVGQYALGSGTGYCNFGAVSANAIERTLVPPSEVLTGSADLSGAGVWELPAGTVGVAIQLTGMPTNQSKDSGDPAELYQVGWVAYQDAHGNQWGPRILLTFEQQLLWGAPPIATGMAYNLYPGVTASVFGYNTETPP